ILGQYSLDELQNSLGTNQFGKPDINLGTGAFLNHARDYLNGNVLNFEQKGIVVGKSLVQYWGVQYQREYFNYQLNEWQLNDSAGYTLPHSPDSVGYVNPFVQPNNPLEMQNVIKGQSIITSNQYTGFYEQKWNMEYDSAAMWLTAGLRANYLDLDKQLLVSPRAAFSYRPNWEHGYIFSLSTGYYSQPPFFKELIGFNGEVNNNVKAQTSIHFVLSGQTDFTAWGRPFHYIAEAYYKILQDLNPYEINDVKIQYYADNSAHGYAAGVDMKVNGEFVPGLESWASISLLKTQEKINGEAYSGYIPTPTDQRLNIGLFFQDFLPKHPTYKMHLGLLYGTGLPFGPPTVNTRYKDTLRYPAYKRVDIGFSKELKGAKTKLAPNNPFHYFKTIWLTLEVFNLLQINNVISYIWVADVTGTQYAVPNYLTPRQVNLKLVIQF
ncbi:MAG: TonB-dependent receptor, partial [Bacteroidales bacterium]